MGSRLRENVRHLFECFCEVAAPVADKDPWLLQRFPESFSEEEILKSVPKFAYPCSFENVLVQHFSFVLTSIDSKWTFGFCRHDPKTETALVILSALPWHETFYKLLNHIAIITASGKDGDLWKFLQDVYSKGVPAPGASLTIPLPDPSVVFVCQSPKQFQLPSIPENRNLTEYYSAIDSHNMMMVFASMLYERRIIFTSKRLSRLSACVQACNALIYPMIWQHIYIPVLPLALMDYLLAPMPFLIGVPAPILERVRQSDLGEVVILDADNNTIQSPFDDLESLPQDVIINLRRALRNRAALLGDGVSRAFLRALVQLTAGYREALTLQQGERITFDEKAFVDSRPSSMQPFLRKMLELQIFQQFIEERLHMLNSGLGFSDEFEMEALNYSEKSGSKFRQQYREWSYAMRKEGSAFFRSVKDKANPAVKSAVKSVKEKGKDMKTAYKGLRWKGRTNRQESGMRYQQPRSAPSSPTLDRRPVAFASPSKPPAGYTATTSYRKDLRFRNTAVPDTSRKQYSPLSPSSPEETDYPVERLDIDLMNELRDVIYPNTPPVDRTLKPVRSLDSLRSAWSGRLRHGPLPSDTSIATDIYEASRTSDSFYSSTLESSSTSSNAQCTTNHKLLEPGTPLNSATFDTLLDISDTSTTNSSSNINGNDTSSPSSIRSLFNLKNSDSIPFASLGTEDQASNSSRLDNLVEKSTRDSHEFVNLTNPFVNKSISHNQSLLEHDDDQNKSGENSKTIAHVVQDSENSFHRENQSLLRISWINNLLDANLNITDPSSQLIADDPFDTSQILNPFHPQNPLLIHPISLKPSPTSIQPLPPLNNQHYSAQAKDTPEPHDLIRLDSTNSDDEFDPLLSKSVKSNSAKQMTQSLHLPQMGEGLTNPLYPYFLPQHKAREDLDLLQEYGLDFNKFNLANSPSSAMTTSCNHTIQESSTTASLNTTTVKTQNNWTKFE
ncbi:DENN domain-containing protein 1A isoform X2 [Neodiprion fabricii]|uniref:DENN domain-containing protein 1A isoform X2 n=1 Tax=Neodiprion fabricii TaxID=2872261 RepID=UPI001ED97055|nr:DENN domain-containing protein 1A isoform X2 [Neodiprion fabricii]